MKIEFGASYAQVNQLAFSRGTSAIPKANDLEFDGLLENLVSEAKPTVELASNQSPTLQSQASDIHYRINIKAPEFQLSDNTPIAPPKIATEGVKTPTVVSAKRVPVSGSNIDSNTQQLKDMISKAGSRSGIDPALSLAVAAAESSFNPKAISADGFASKGLFQLLDSTGKHMLEQLGLEGSYDPFSPKQNIDLGVGYLRKLHELFNSATVLENNSRTFKAANSSSLEKLAVAAFNAGEGRVASAQERAQRSGKDPAHYDQVSAYLPESTKEYVQRVLEFKDSFDDENTPK